ncbi:flagellar basal body rod modification protein [Paracoccus subflavus]|uniref:Basal-body rod modification protein FlgD n=1 Tax=Paracoccus subflavus TaxID=2528244 RepID=A0A4Q9FYF6_9RHOB|nr:flagellar hook capping FlgD N-terminal domain-containing protein [Paracoccus subflavus]TBN36781.1 flagellar basal body rod modification protein [Paracoccus subflavus]
MIPSLGGAPAATSATATGTANASSAISANFDTFLKMLTTQLRNQDPLNPMEGSDFAVQLATFSGVEQQAQTNKLLAQMAAQLGDGLGQVATWIGKEVRTTEPVWFGDEPVTLDIAPDSRADSVVLVARNAAGAEIAREEIGPGEGQIDWYGRDAQGGKLPDGRYSFTVESSRAGEVISEDPVGAYARVVEAEMGAQGAKLILLGGGSVLASEVEALRDAR